jgi:phenylalanyl-tRNA synthetase beta subunit
MIINYCPQEQSREPLIFKPFSKHPPCFKDISFWIRSEQFTENNFFEIVRGEAGDIAERVDLVCRPLPQFLLS